MEIDLSNIQFSSIDQKRGIKLPNRITEELAYLTGIFAGDGCICIRTGRKDYRIYCVGNPKDEIEFYSNIIIPLIKNLFNIDVKGKLREDGTYGIEFGSKAVVQFFTKILRFPVGKKYGKLRIPSIFKTDGKHILSFIGGLADTDFGLSLKKKYKKFKYYPTIACVSKDKYFLNEVFKEINKLNFKTTKLMKIVDIDNRTKKGFTIVYRFDLNGHYNLNKWMEVIGFKNPKYIKRYNLWVKRNKDNPRCKNLIKSARSNSGGWI